MKPTISEFSYGFALTRELIESIGLPLVEAPFFPSLIQEGQGPGIDVGLNFSGILVFLQFKLSHYMVRNSAIEVQNSPMSVPLYRMYLMPTSRSQQHPSLLLLEQIVAPDGHLVFYATPAFHLLNELNDAYFSGEVEARSWFFRPSDIGQLPDDDEHFVSFNNTSGPWRFSEPEQIKHSEFRSLIFGHVERAADVALSPDGLVSLATKMADLVRRLHPKQVPDERLSSRLTPLGQIVYLSRTFFDSNVLVLGRQRSAAG